jgi:hypothetical protein
MASTHKSLRSSTANKRPTTAIADGQIALNTNATSPGLFFKDSAGTVIIKIGPVHVGTTAPNVSPGAGGSTGNSTGEAWLDTSLTPNGWKVWTGAAWVNATPAGSDTVQGLLELATNAETQTGSDTARAVTPAGLQSKVSDSTSTTSSTTIASSTAVKSAYDLANAALPKSGGTVTGNLEIGTTGSLTFEGATADAFETTLAVVDPTADRTITFPDATGTIVTTGDTGTITSAMIANGTIVDADVNASAAISLSKLATGALPTAITIASANIVDGSILNADVNASAAIAGTKISPDFGSQTIATTGVFSHALGAAATPSITFTGDLNTGFWSPTADALAASTAGSERLRIDSSGRLLIGTSSARSNFYNSTVSAILQAEGIGTTNRVISFISSSSDGLEGPYFIFGKQNSGSIGGNTVVASGDNIGTISFQGSDGTEFVESASIKAFVDGTPGANDMPGRLVFSTTADGAASPTERLRIDSSGRVGIGTTSPGSALEINAVTATSPFIAKINNVEAARIDSSGRLLIGTSSARSNFYNSTVSAILQAEGIGTTNRVISFISSSSDGLEGPYFIFGKQNSGSIGGNTVVASGDNIGTISFQGSDGTEFVESASIKAFVDGTPGANDMPGRLVFSTTADGAASPTERMRIKSTGIINFSNAPTYADNTAATAGGLAVGDVYKTALGVLMIRY